MRAGLSAQAAPPALTPAMLPEPWVLSIAMVAVLALALGAAQAVRRRGDRRQGLLMVLAAAVLLANVLIWAWP